jgi:hypothetical protein
MAHLPQDLRAAHEAALNDEELESLKDELALLTTRTQQVLERLSATPPPPWGQAVAAFNALSAARKADREAKLADLGNVLRAGADAAKSQEATWEELKDLIGLRSRVADSEIRRRYAADRVLTADQAMMYVSALIEAARSVLADQPDRFKTLNARVLTLLPPARRSDDD